MASIPKRQKLFIEQNRGIAFSVPRAELVKMPLDTLVDKVLFEIGTQLTDKLKANLRESDAVATASLLQSINFTIDNLGSVVIFRLTMDDYYPFVDQGVKGAITTYDDARASPFQFKRKLPPREPLEKWITAKGIKLEGKDKLAARRSLAHVFQRSIWRKGQHATRFYSDVINEDTKEQIKAKIINAAKQYINVYFIQP